MEVWMEMEVKRRPDEAIGASPIEEIANVTRPLRPVGPKPQGISFCPATATLMSMSILSFLCPSHRTYSYSPFSILG